jgi:hypothetical protein
VESGSGSGSPSGSSPYLWAVADGCRAADDKHRHHNDAERYRIAHSAFGVLAMTTVNIPPRCIPQR